MKRKRKKAKYKLDNRQKSSFIRDKRCFWWSKCSDLWVLTGVILVSLFAWWPTRYLPYHWDSAGFVINAARELLQHNFHPLIVGFSDFAHPPGFIALLAISWKLFGQHLLVSHLLMFPFYPILIFSIYLLGKKLVNSELGILVAALVAAMPGLIAEYGMIYLDLPMAALAILSLTLWVYKKYLWAIIALSLAVLFKLPAILVLSVFILDVFFDKDKQKNKQLIYSLFVPLITLFSWLYYHYLQTGWLLSVPGRPNLHPNSLKLLTNNVNYVVNKTFLAQGKWILLLFIVFGLLQSFVIKKDLKLSKLFYYLLLFLLISSGFFIWMGEYGIRYGLFFIPIYILLGITFLRQIFTKKWFFYTLYIFIITGFVLAMHPKIVTRDYILSPFDDLQYQDLISLGQKAAIFLQLSHPKANIYGVFPESYQLTEPYQGYVLNKLNFTPCDKFKYLSDKEQIIYIHAYSPKQLDCRKLLDIVDTRVLKRFDQNGKWLELYEVVGSGSAKLK